MTQLKCKKTTPCKECPFLRTSIPGWLGPDTAEEVMQKVHGEGGYVCHTSIDGKPNLDDGTVDVAKYGHQCIGAVISASLSCKSYRDPNLNNLQKECKGMENTYPILGRMEFMTHHANLTRETIGKLIGKSQGTPKQKKSRKEKVDILVKKNKKVRL